jgi:hypothetical protein
MADYRDNEEALRQRTDALERDLVREQADKERLRQDLEAVRRAAEEDHELAEGARKEKRAAEEKRHAAAQKKRQAQETRARDAARGGSAGWWKKARVGVFTALTVGFVFSAIGVLVVWGEYWWSSGEIKHGWFVSRPGEPTALLLLSNSDWDRLELVDPASGRRLARRNLWGRGTRCEPPSADRLWCLVSGKLELRALSDLGVIADEDKLVRGAAELAAGIHHRPMTTRGEGTVVVTTNAGHTCSIDPVTLRVQRIEENDRVRPSESGARTAVGYGSPVPGLRLEGQVEKRLTRSSNGSRERSQPLAPELTFLKGQFLQQTIPGGFVVVHDSTLDAKKRRLVFTAVSTDGKRLWSRSVEHSPVLEARISGELLVIVTERCVVGLQLGDGAKRWTYRT